MGWLTPARRRGFEILDDPSTPRAVRERSLRDVAHSNTLLGGARAMLSELRTTLHGMGPRASLLDVGTGIADIPARATRLAQSRGLSLTTVGVDYAESLARANRDTVSHSVCANAQALPFASATFDIVTCSQLLHHFEYHDALQLLRELHRVARQAVIVSDLRRSWVAAAGFWLVTFPLGFHPVTRHDGVTSVLRGFTRMELQDLVITAVPASRPVVHRRLGYRLTACWFLDHSRALTR